MCGCGKVVTVVLRKSKLRARDMGKIKLIPGASILLLVSATSAYGVTLHVDGTGHLFGASGVDVGGSFYDVEFVDGSCIDLFDGCDSRWSYGPDGWFIKDSDFTFNNTADALLASEALLSRVFIDSGGVLFDSIPSATNRCEAGSNSFCIIVTIIGIDTVTYIDRLVASFVYNTSYIQDRPYDTSIPNTDYFFGPDVTCKSGIESCDYSNVPSAV